MNVSISVAHGTLKYKIGDDLHIGISDSRSVVHSYWTNGISSENAYWDMSIVVHQFTDEDANWFDNSLFGFLAQYSNNFVPHLYNDIEWNCFDLVMEFLRYVNFRNYTKVHFVAEFVQESLKTAIKYCKLFEIFTHDYREYKDAPRCESHTSGDKSCSSKEESGYKKKDIVNITRKLQKAVFVLQSVPGNDTVIDMVEKLEDLNARLQTAIKDESAEFTLTTLNFPDFDPVDMDLFLGDCEVPRSLTLLEAVEDDQRMARQRMQILLFEAEIMLREYDHLKNGLQS
uniref:CACTA en-spm transposon protein n=1 Tax=Heterorhabditis bacteriophora TaxID=37862 RepID=A0A1I7XU75_HETBA